MEHVLSLSYGKDSMASIESCFQLGYKIDRIVHADLWATDTILADLPEMVDFKCYADKVIKSRYGLEVEHIHATDKFGNKITYENYFYTVFKKGKRLGQIKGFPFLNGPWCNCRLKVSPINKFLHRNPCVQILGIAADEKVRIERFSKDCYFLPLVDVGFTEKDCFKWCKDHNLLSPIYSTSQRGGCWFCHNQSLEQLRLLRKNYPEYWNLLLQWDLDSPVTFKPSGLTVHDYELRFTLEDNGVLQPKDKSFKWRLLNDDIQVKLPIFD